MRRFFGLSALLLALLSSPAGAQEPSLDADPRVAAGLKAAERHWGQPTPPCVRVVAEFPPGGEASGGLAWAAPEGCLIWISPRWWATNLLPITVCTVIVHERGHQLGFEHVSDPGSVMAAAPWTPPVCLPPVVPRRLRTGGWLPARGRLSGPRK